MAMVARCTNANHVKFPRYGGRGITVCERWRSFESFLADMGERPEGTTIDRFPNRDGNYEPGNCRWATATEQAANRSRGSFNTNGLKTHCPAGHPYAGDNVRSGKSGRRCRTCDRIRAQRKRDAAKAGADR
jgi:hypothetical protein